ncbi:MAG: DNA polymerase I [Candidatus Omnitrophota bacterium]
MSEKRLYLIDANAFCYRAFYALPVFSTSFGQATNAIYGFINILNKILKEQKPGYLAVCFDISRDTFRTKKFTDYKMNRPPMPSGLVGQIPLIKEVVKAYGITIFEKEGFEADDIIATLAKKAKEKKVGVTIISSDKDILQLVDQNTLVFSPYKDTGILYDRDKVLERYGIEPEKIPDIISLMGDSVDNIPGVPGIGEKTASSLIKKFGSLKNLLQDIENIESEKIKQSIKDNLERVGVNKELALLDKEMNLDFNLQDLKIGQPKYKELFRIFKYLEFKKLLKDLPVEKETPSDIKIQSLEDKALKGFINAPDELVLYGEGDKDIVFFANDKFFRLESFGTNIKNILADQRIEKIGHDLKKVKFFLSQSGIILEGIYFDTMIASYLINPSKSYNSLIDVAWDYLKFAVQGEHLDNSGAIKLILELRKKLEKELTQKSLEKLFRETEMPLVSVLSEMELSGIKLDVEVLTQLSKDLDKRLKQLIEDIYRISQLEFNINSPKQLREILFEKLKLPVVKKTKTGPSTDEEVLKTLAVLHELPQLLLEYRQLTKLKNTYVDTLPELIDKKTGRIHTCFNQTGTETGRLSSTNPNLQNLPIKTDVGSLIRRAIIAYGPKDELLSSDYSQIELRILAHLSKDDNLIEAFRENKDIHKATASLIYAVQEKDVTALMREVAKRINFGIVYGLSSWGLSRDLGIGTTEAQNFIDAYFLKYKKVKVYIEEQIKIAKVEGFVTTILGRRRYLPEINNKNQGIRQLAERQAVNTPIQGSASDLIKLAMIQIHQEIKEKSLKTKMILQIHDELVFNVPLDELNGLAELVKNHMEHVLKLDVPIRISMKKGKNWLDMEAII